jgi:hypothetical protein
MGSMGMGVTLARLVKVERTYDTSDRDADAAYLRERFAGAVYDAHRERLIRALLSRVPVYGFQGDEGYYLISWCQRRTSGALTERQYVGVDGDLVTGERLQPPHVKRITVQPRPEPAPAPEPEPDPEPEPAPPVDLLEQFQQMAADLHKPKPRRGHQDELGNWMTGEERPL